MKKVIAASFLVLFFASYSEISAFVENNIKATAKSGNGGSASSKVIVNNNVNTRDSYNSVESSTSTSVDIDQSGEGTSEVTINGKTWKQEGPGKITIRDNVTLTGTPSATPSVSGTPTPTPTVLGTSTESKPGGFKGFMASVFEAMRKFFSRIF